MEAQLEDLEWADAYIFGTPARFGNVSAQLKQFIDTTGGLWFEGKLADKVVSGFTSAQNAHGGQESTLLSMYNVFAHWGAILATPGYTDPDLFESGGNPYGASSTEEPEEQELAAASSCSSGVAWRRRPSFSSAAASREDTRAPTGAGREGAAPV